MAEQASAADMASKATESTIDALPYEGQNIVHDGQSYTTIKEGLAHILVPHDIPTSTDPKMSKEDTQKQQVFYNPIQQFNRDLSVLAIKTFGNDLVHRKTEKHERQKAKANKLAQKKKQRTQASAGENVQEEPRQPEESAPLKRKATDTLEGDLVKDEQHTGDGTHKKQRIGENDEGLPTDSEGGHVPYTMPGQNGVNAEKAQKPSEWKPPFTILDALSATGLRALRYAKEIPASTSITANDMSSKATDSIALNVRHNKLDDKIHANTGNAIAHMYSHVEKKGYDVIDLDPYGTAAPFIDAAIQAINDDGMLCVTCTDSAIFASHGYLEKTYSQYGGLPLKGTPCHEGGLRLILHAIASSAGRYGMAIEPLLSLSIDYYIRVFVRVRKAPNEVKLLAGKTMIVYHCDSGCGSWTTQFLARNKPKLNKDGTPSYKHSFAAAPTADQHCQHCGFKAHLSGPMYGGPLHNIGFIERTLAQLNEVDRETYPTYDRIEGMLRTALDEITYGVKSKSSDEKSVQQLGPLIPKADPALVDDHPFFFVPSAISRVLHCSAPPLAAMRGALLHAGFRTTMSHCKPGSIRTDASWTAIWHILLEWTRQKAPLKNPLKAGTAGSVIMSKASAHQATNGEAEDGENGAELNESGKDDVHMAHAGGDRESEATKSADSVPSYLDAKFPVTFDEHLGRDRDRGKYVRYQLAPRENWGPMSRAK